MEQVIDMHRWKWGFDVVGANVLCGMVATACGLIGAASWGLAKEGAGWIVGVCLELGSDRHC